MPADVDATESTILRLLEAAGRGKSVSPTEAARALTPDADWHRLMPQVRRAAVRLARAGQIVITRKGKPVDPNDFKGVYRLALPGYGEAGPGNSADERPVHQ
jgi:hypothetical protein